MSAELDPQNDPALARQRLAAVAAVSSLVTHAGRNRLAVARAALELVQAKMEADFTDEQRNAFLQQLDLFLGDFNLGVDALRCHEGQVEAISAREAALEVLEAGRPRAEAEGIALDLDFDEGPDDVMADRALLRLALLNLVRNSIQALEGAASPRIRIIAKGAAAAERFQIAIEDNGPGVATEIRDKIFKEYVTTRRSAAGIGLCLCRDAMTVMGGAVSWRVAEGGRGARFWVELRRVGRAS